MGFFLRLTAVLRSILRLRHARPSSVYARRCCEQGGSRGLEVEDVIRFSVGIECAPSEIPGLPCFPNSVKVSHVRA